MRILYCAIDQRVPGTTGGPVHVRAAAEGLAARGHEVHALARPGTQAFPEGLVRWHGLGPPLGSPKLRLARVPQVFSLARRLKPDAIIERYHNFGGEGLLAARRLRVLSVLEINAPAIDYPGSVKRLLDRAVLVQPMRRWRDWQCASADLLVTPLAAIVPPWVPRERIVEIEWGADTERFHPGAQGRVPFERKAGDTIAVFAGAFRRWHGAVRLVDAVRQLRGRGVRQLQAVFIGDGPEWQETRRAARELDGVTFVGAIAHDDMPAALAAADIGVAPFDVAAHPSLSLGFYWSPLKIFEYMASGLPVVAPAIDGVRRVLTDRREGLLYDPATADGLAAVLERLLDPGERLRLGTAARARVVTDFSWQRHCETLDAAMRAALTRRGQIV